MTSERAGSSSQKQKRASNTPAATSTPSKKSRTSTSTSATGRRTRVFFEDKDDEEDFVETSQKTRKAARVAPREAAVDKLWIDRDDDFSESFIAAETQRAIDIITGNRWIDR